MAEKITTQERYLSATGTSDLRVLADRRTDADQLLAAAYSASGSPRKMLALDVWRLRATSSAAGARAIAERMAGIVVHRSKPGRYGVPRISRIHAKDLSMVVIKLWQLPVCPACHGRGLMTFENAPVLDESRPCPECDGTGKRQLERVVRPEHLEHAAWLASEMESLASMVFHDMARRLNQSMEF